MIAALVVFVYAFGFLVTWRAIFRDQVQEFGVPRDFMDWLGNCFAASCLALSWPFVAFAMIAWRVYRRRHA